MQYRSSSRHRGPQSSRSSRRLARVPLLRLRLLVRFRQPPQRLVQLLPQPPSYHLPLLRHRPQLLRRRSPVRGYRQDFGRRRNRFERLLLPLPRTSTRRLRQDSLLDWLSRGPVPQSAGSAQRHRRRPREHLPPPHRRPRRVESLPSAAPTPIRKSSGTRRKQGR